MNMMEKLKTFLVAALLVAAIYATSAGAICLLWNFWIADFLKLPHITFGVAVSLKLFVDIMNNNRIKTDNTHE